jgi:uncharacterized phage infection (PIP) family protein YhgE
MLNVKCLSFGILSEFNVVQQKNAPQNDASHDNYGVIARDDATSFQNSATSFQNGTNSFRDGATYFQNDATSLHDSVTSLQNDASSFQSGATSLQDSVTSFQDGARDLDSIDFTGDDASSFHLTTDFLEKEKSDCISGELMSTASRVSEGIR